MALTYKQQRGLRKHCRILSNDTVVSNGRVEEGREGAIKNC